MAPGSPATTRFMAASSREIASRTPLSAAASLILVLRDAGQAQPEEPPGVALVDLRLLLGGRVDPLERPDRLPDEAGPLLGVERHVGPEQNPVGAEEPEPALERVVGAEDGG